MPTININSTKVIENSMSIWNNLLRLNVLRKANHEEDEEHYNNINEVVHSIFKVAIQVRQLKQEKEGDNTTNEDYDDYEEEIKELIEKEIVYLQKEHPEILLNMPTNVFERCVIDVLKDKDTMNVAIMQWANMVMAKEGAVAFSNGGSVATNGVNNAQSTVGMPTSGGMPMGTGGPAGTLWPTGVPGQFPPNMGNVYPHNPNQNPNQNQEATIVPQDTPEGKKAIDEIDKQTDGHLKKKLSSFTKNGIHPQVALVATNTGALLVGMLIPGASFLVMTATLKANLEILPKWPKKKLKPVTHNWFKNPENNKPDKDNPNDNKKDPNNPNNPQQTNPQMPANAGWPPNNGAMQNGMAPAYVPNGMGGGAGSLPQTGVNAGAAGAVGATGSNVSGVGYNRFKKPLQIWETVAANLVHNNRIKTETKLTYYVDKDGKIYINSKEYGIKSDKEYIELTTENLQDYLMFIAEKNGLGETESMKEFIDQVSKIAKGEIGIKEINNGIVGVIDASTKLSEMMDDGELSDYGKETYNELLLKKIENLVEFDPKKPIEEEVIKQLEETQKILTEKLTPENLEKLNDKEKKQFTQMLNGVSSTLNMAKIYQGVKLIEEKKREIDLLKDKKKLEDLYKDRDDKNKQKKELEDDNIKIQKEKQNLNKQIEEEQEQVNKFQEIVDLQTKRDNLEKQFEKELEDLRSSFGVIGLFEDSKDNGMKDQIENEIQNKIKERDEQLQEIDTQLQEKGVNSQEAKEYLQQHQDNLNKLKQQQTNLETREEENNEKIATITESKDEIDKEIYKQENKVEKEQTKIEKELEQSKQEKLNKLQNEKKEVEKLKKEKEEIEASKKELDELILKKEEEIKIDNEIKELSNNINSKQNKIEQIKEKLEKEKDEQKQEELNSQQKQLEEEIKILTTKKEIDQKKIKINNEKDEGKKQELNNELQQLEKELEKKIKELNNNKTALEKKEEKKEEKSMNLQTTDKDIKETYNNKIKEKNDIIKKINDLNEVNRKYEKDQESLSNKRFKTQTDKDKIEELQKQIDENKTLISKYVNDMTLIDLEIEDIKPQIELMELKEKRQLNETKKEQIEKELRKHGTVEEINENITKTKERYTTKKNVLEDVGSIEKKEEELGQLRQEVLQKKQNSMSQDLVLAQKALLRNPSFKGLGKIVKVESIDMPQYQPPVISINISERQHDKQL